MPLITVYGVAALSFMTVMYALDRRGRPFILAFAAGCLLSSAYPALRNVDSMTFVTRAQPFF